MELVKGVPEATPYHSIQRTMEKTVPRNVRTLAPMSGFENQTTCRAHAEGPGR